ncbi:DBH-like monooxygenase protein 1 [Orchesella cincta]|uniref:DBH-like monooxygenase protein 1 n=1 Tax=Orchesella cincta TaxID=48709 RepID=A0A1D2N304_ORCCI|nr:DBH-like monooxygenase protein 1 [Orchesella cincta]
MFPDGGMKVVALLLHSHNQGRKLKIQHFRNGKELPWISKDDNFNFDFQPGRNLRKEATILPGDQVTMKCIYDTTNRNSTTVGGYGTDQEMCKTFLTYYPKMNDYGLCRSMIVSPKFTKRYLGINNFTWDRSQIEYIVNSPSELEALTISKVSDTVIDWNDELRAQLRLDHITRPQAVICPISTASPSREAVAKEMVNMSPDFATLPTQAIPYQPKTQC